jgi:VWFA-related protein
MVRRGTRLARAGLILVFFLSAQSLAFADDFGMIVGKIEKHYTAKKKKIPFLGLAGFAVKLIHPAGVKSFKLAIFENQDFKADGRDRVFEQAFTEKLNSKWKPMVRSRDRSSGTRAFVYTHQTGKDIEMLTVTFSNDRAIVAQAKVNPEAMSRFIDKPELMGMSLASANGLSSPFDPSSSVFNPGSTGTDSNSTGDSALGDPISTAGDAKSRPELRRRSAGDVDFNPAADAPAPVPASRPEEGAIRLEARLINLNVKVADRGGNPLSNLGREDFRILEDGVEQKIFSFEPVSAPIKVVLLLDCSGSTSSSRGLMIEAAKTFIDALSADDRVAITAFTRKLYMLSDFTNDKNALKEAVEKVRKIEGGTAFYDSMCGVFDLLERVKDSRKAIVVLTDGVDESLMDHGYERTKHSFEEMLDRAREAEATIYPIYVNPEEARLLNELQRHKQEAKGDSPSDIRSYDRWTERLERRLKPNVIAHRQIEQLADETSGTVFVAHGLNELGGVYQRVAAELRLIYTLSYEPKRIASDGKFRKLEVQVKSEGAIVKTRRGYFAK